MTTVLSESTLLRLLADAHDREEMLKQYVLQLETKLDEYEQWFEGWGSREGGEPYDPPPIDFDEERNEEVRGTDQIWDVPEEPPEEFETADDVRAAPIFPTARGNECD